MLKQKQKILESKLFAGGIARTILRQYDYHWAEEPYVPNFELRRAAAKQNEELNDKGTISAAEMSNVITPNPATHGITLNLSGVEATGVSIVNLHGQEVQFAIVPANTAMLKVPLNLVAGIYFVSLYNNDTLLGTSKLIIR